MARPNARAIAPHGPSAEQHTRSCAEPSPAAPGSPAPQPWGGWLLGADPRGGRKLRAQGGRYQRPSARRTSLHLPRPRRKGSHALEPQRTGGLHLGVQRELAPLCTSRTKLEGNRSTGLPREKECCPANPGSAPRLRTVLQAGLCSPPTDGRQKMIAHVEQNASEPRIAPPRALRRSSHRSTAASARRAWALSALSAPLRLRGGRPEQVSPPRVTRWARPSSFWSRRV